MRGPSDKTMDEGVRGMGEAGYVHLDDRGVVALSGPERRPFLQGLISNDVDRLDRGRALFAALLTPQGKFLFELLLYDLGERILIETERERVPALVQRLMLYRLRAKVDVADASDEFAIAAIVGSGIEGRLGLEPEAGACRDLEGGVVAVDPRLVDLGGRAVLPSDRMRPVLEALGLSELPRSAYESRRLALGVPDGSRDLVLERATLLESGFDELNGVDFKKGCFVGQELTARMKYRGLVRKRLLPVAIEGPAPEPGTVLRLDGRDAGEMRSSDGDRGLALLRLAQVARAMDGGPAIQAGETRLEPRIPAWSSVTLE